MALHEIVHTCKAKNKAEVISEYAAFLEKIFKTSKLYFCNSNSCKKAHL